LSALFSEGFTTGQPNSSTKPQSSLFPQGGRKFGERMENQVD
jgi:hypothetical protein